MMRMLLCLLRFTMEANGTTTSPLTEEVLSNNVTAFFDDPTQRFLVALFYCVFSVAGLAGNGLVIFAVLRFRSLRTMTNVFVINLAVADFVGCLLLPLAALPYVTDELPYSKIFCAVMIAVTYTMFAASVVNLGLIAVNRYVLVTRPKVRYLRLYRKHNVSVMLFCSWVYAATLVVVPPIFGVGALGYSKEYRVCGTVSEHPLISYYSAIRFILGLIPCLSLAIFCYVAIFCFVCKSSRQRKKLFRGSSRVACDKNPKALDKIQIRVTRNLFITMCAYIILVGPYILVYLIPGLESLRPWAAVCGTLNSCVNPIIYGYGHPHFKEAFKSIFKRQYLKETLLRPVLFWRRRRLAPKQTVFSISTSKRPRDKRKCKDVVDMSSL